MYECFETIHSSIHIVESLEILPTFYHYNIIFVSANFLDPFLSIQFI